MKNIKRLKNFYEKSKIYLIGSISIGCLLDGVLYEYISIQITLCDFIARNAVLIFWILQILPLLISLIISIMKYIKNINADETLCSKVIEIYDSNNEQYQRFVELEKGIKEFNKENQVLELKIRTLEASIEYDKTINSLFSIIMVVLTFASKYIFSKNIFLIGAAILPLLLSLKLVVKGIPRNAFISVVIEKIKNDEKLNK